MINNIRDVHNLSKVINISDIVNLGKEHNLSEIKILMIYFYIMLNVIIYSLNRKRTIIRNNVNAFEFRLMCLILF